MVRVCVCVSVCACASVHASSAHVCYQSAYRDRVSCVSSTHDTIISSAASTNTKWISGRFCNTAESRRTKTSVLKCVRRCVAWHADFCEQTKTTDEYWLGHRHGYICRLPFPAQPPGRFPSHSLAYFRFEFHDARTEGMWACVCFVWESATVCDEHVPFKCRESS